MFTQPEEYTFAPTSTVPNNVLPVLVYRNVLPQPRKESTTQEFLEGNEWMKGGVWGAVPQAHFHPNTHECYAVIQGHSVLRVGCPVEGQLIEMSPGDVIVLPAGVSHFSTDSDPEYRYIGVYPKGAPKWKNEYCKLAERLPALQKESSMVRVPDFDPVQGRGGPLVSIWTAAKEAETARLV